ncbi:hypothetical protein PRIPAC_97427 [Pristionchus pacificus]|uniref:Uncharacterized protein n=1 Tax=Pristionchus pacificus TaxID=54126 RepID=A0A2A6BXR8_PRIPA|nr:hypothetical protein PRIPAC_97427 [Pristionchus pacificus]|eukprot:PDM70678.1 hypothetical protein PRIPAC_43883 [Pristionchus pacificus]
MWKVMLMILVLLLSSCAIDASPVASKKVARTKRAPIFDRAALMSLETARFYYDLADDEYPYFGRYY